MLKITCKYFSTMYIFINKPSETFDVEEGTTVEDVLDAIAEKYGESIKEFLYSEGSIEGTYYKTASVYVNNKRIQWVQDFPDGLKTKLKEGDVLSLGLIMGGGAGHTRGGDCP